MSLTGKDIAEIAKLLDASHFTTLDLQQGEFRLRIRRSGGGWDEEEEQERVPAQAGTSPGEEPKPEPDNGPRLRGDSPGEASDNEVDIPAPLIGNFYAAPRPGEPPFVAVGDRIEEDTVVAIIEVMKLMNSVSAGVAGTVTAVLAENGSAVEEGQPLIRVKVS